VRRWVEASLVDGTTVHVDGGFVDVYASWDSVINAD
jgi:hypothetical protein